MRAVVVAVAVMLSGCGTTATLQQPRPKVIVFAAASLTAAFKAIAAQSPELDIAFTFDGSPTLVEQLTAKPDLADVLATADEVTMKKATDAGLVAGAPAIFATNTAVMIVPHDNPARITGLDASLTGRKLVVCAATVPCGAAARMIAQNTGFTLKPVSEEQKVSDVVGKVTSGEADAGIVFATDAQAAAGKVRVLPLPGAERVVSRYPIGITDKAPHGDAGARFVAVVRSDQGRAVLASYGFTLP